MEWEAATSADSLRRAWRMVLARALAPDTSKLLVNINLEELLSRGIEAHSVAEVSKYLLCSHVERTTGRPHVVVESDDLSDLCRRSLGWRGSAFLARVVCDTFPSCDTRRVLSRLRTAVRFCFEIG